jgi:hypothetical protein
MLQRWWANLTGQNMNIKTGGRVFSGDKISINGDIVGGRVIINGVVQDGMTATPKISIEILGGTVHTVETSQNLTCGEVTGGVTAGMDVNCGNITGDVDAGMTVKAKDINGRVDAGMNVDAHTITGNANAGMSVKATNIGGTAKGAF